MRNLNELIILIRGAGEEGTAIAHRLYRSHFRICMTELENPLAVYRGAAFSDAVYDNEKTVDKVTAELAKANLESIYKVWRKGNIAVVVDPECTVRPMIKPDIIINAMMLKREVHNQLSDDRLYIGIGPGFYAGKTADLVIETNGSNNLGKVIIKGEAEQETTSITDLKNERFLSAVESGVFTSSKNIGDSVNANDVVGQIDDKPIVAQISGILCGLLRSDTKVLDNTVVAEIDPINAKDSCSQIRSYARAIAGGVLEAVMMSMNVSE